MFLNFDKLKVLSARARDVGTAQLPTGGDVVATSVPVIFMIVSVQGQGRCLWGGMDLLWLMSMACTGSHRGALQPRGCQAGGPPGRPFDRARGSAHADTSAWGWFRPGARWGWLSSQWVLCARGTAWLQKSGLCRLSPRVPQAWTAVPAYSPEN